MHRPVHVYLVSNQPTPNLTPALDTRLRPARVILLVSPGMREQARWLEEVLSSRGIVTREWPVDHAFDIEHVQNRVLELLEDEIPNVKAKRIQLNATGGTKPMSIAAYEAFRAYELPIFYVHPEKDRLVWLFHPDQPPAINIQDRIRLEPFLQAHGVNPRAELSRNIPNKALLEAGQQIVAHVEGFSRALGVLNFLAHKARATGEVEIERGHLRIANSLIELFAEHGFLQHSRGKLRFPDEDSRFFVNGGWLEYLVFDAARSLRRDDDRIQDVARSVNVERIIRGETVPNELDVVFLRDNRLYLIECKTSRFKDKGEDSHGAGVLYKLDALGDIMGGIKSRALLVSYQKFQRKDRDRARMMGIEVCAGAELQRLKTFLKKAIEPT